MLDFMRRGTRPDGRTGAGIRACRGFVGRRALLALALAAASLGLAAYAMRAGFKSKPDHLQVPAGHVAILIRKEGRPLPQGEFIAPAVGPGEVPYQGIQEDVVPPGVYGDVRDDDFAWEIVPMVTIPPESVGVLVRQFGQTLPAGRVLADETEETPGGPRYKGVLRRTLEIGTHAVNLRAYSVLLYPRATIQPGQVGVIVHRIGPQPTDPSALIAGPNERGVQRVVLPPGTHYVNPFVDTVIPISRQSQRLDLATPGVRVRFPTRDGFDIALDGTIEWGVPDAAAPAVFAKFGTVEQAQDHLIVPATRAISRLHGSRIPARDFILGSKRQSFQAAFETGLRQVVEAEDLVVHSVTISGITPPKELATLIQQRVDASLARVHYQTQLDTEKSLADLARQKELEKRPGLLGKVRAHNAEIASGTRQKSEKSEIDAAREIAIASFGLDAAKAKAENIRLQGRADAEQARVKGLADADATAARAAAVGGGLALSRARLVERVAPHIRSVLAAGGGPRGLIEMFTSLVEPGAAIAAAPAAGQAEQSEPDGEKQG